MNYQEFYIALVRLKNSIYLIPNHWTRKGYNLPNTLQAIEYILTYWNTVDRDRAIQKVVSQLPVLNPNLSSNFNGLGALTKDAKSTAIPTKVEQQITSQPFSTGGSTATIKPAEVRKLNTANVPVKTLPVTVKSEPKKVPPKPQEIVQPKVVISTPVDSKPQNTYNLDQENKIKISTLDDSSKTTITNKPEEGNNLALAFTLTLLGATIILFASREKKDKKTTEKNLSGVDKQHKTTAKKSYHPIKGKTIHAII